MLTSSSRIEGSIKPLALMGLVDLHPAPGEEEIRRVEWSDTKLYVVQRAASFRECVTAARDVNEGISCVGRFISSIPPALARRSLAVAEDIQVLAMEMLIPSRRKHSLHPAPGRSKEERTSSLFCAAARPAAGHPRLRTLRIPPPLHVHDLTRIISTRHAQSLTRPQSPRLRCTVLCSLMTHTLPPPQVGEGDDANPKLLAMTLSRCLDASLERDAAIFCISDLLSSVPRTSLNIAIERGEAHPNFFWLVARNNTHGEAEKLGVCVRGAASAAAGEECLGDFFSALPLGLVDRAQYVAHQLAEVTVAEPKEEESLSALPACFEAANGQDGAIFCLARFLRGVPAAQISNANTWSLDHPSSELFLALPSSRLLVLRQAAHRRHPTVRVHVRARVPPCSGKRVCTQSVASAYHFDRPDYAHLCKLIPIFLVICQPPRIAGASVSPMSSAS